MSRKSSIRAAAHAPVTTPRDLTRALGASGLSMFAGVLSRTEDYAPDWSDTRRYKIIDKMRSRSGALKGARLAIKAPLLRAAWTIDPADPDDPVSVEQAQAVELNLLHNMAGGWDSFLRHALLAIEYGHCPHEITLRDAGDSAEAGYRWQIDALLPRKPHTITEWRADAQGAVTTACQLAPRPGGGLVSVEIPADHLMLLAWDAEFGDPRGRSMYRECYKHWYMIDLLEQVASIAAERRGAGLLIGTLTPETVTEYQALAEAAMRTVNGHDKAYLVAVKDAIEYELTSPSGPSPDLIALIEYHERNTLRALGQDWLALTGDGSRAMHTDKTAMSRLVIESVGDWIVAEVNALIARLVGWNWGEGVAPPTLAYSTLISEDASTLIAAIGNAATTGAMPRDRALVDRLRALADLSPLSDDAEIVEYDIDPSQRVGGMPFAMGAVRRGGRVQYGAAPIAAARWKAPRPAVGPEVYVNFARLAVELDETESVIVRRARPILREVGDSMIEQARVIFESRSGSIGKLLKVKPPADAEDRIAAVVSDELAEMIREGRASVRSEAAAQRADRTPMPSRVRGPDTGPSEAAISARIHEPITVGTERSIAAKIADWLALHGATSADAILTRFSGALLTEIGRQAQEGTFDAPTLVSFYERLSDSPIRQQIRLITSDALAIGRQTEQDNNVEDTAYSYYSTMLDPGVCSVCAALEGRHFEPGSPERADSYPPLDSRANGTCFGVSNCRCVMIDVLRTEAPALA